MIAKPDAVPGRYLARLLLAASALLIAAPVAVIADTQTRSPSSCSNVGGAGSVAWSNADEAEASDNDHATANVDGSETRYLRCLDYGFAIPAGSTINGIVVRVERHSSRTSNGGSRDEELRLVRNGAIGGADRATNTTYGTNDATEAHGGASDLWGATWTAADINAANFGAAFRATKPSSNGPSHQIRVDHIEITVDYTPPTFPVVTAIDRASTDPTVPGSTVLWVVTFDVSVSGVDTSDFALVEGGGVSGASILSVSGGGAIWTVSAYTGSGTGTLGLNLVDDDSITDGTDALGGAGAGNGNFAGQVYTVASCQTAPASGLLGSYFNNTTLSGTPVGTRDDGPIDFAWGTGTPGVPGVGADSFSVGWDGFLRVETSRTYRFQTVSDEAVRLWVDNTLVIDNWTAHTTAVTDTSGDIALAAGQTYPIRLEYRDETGNAEIRLRWGWCDSGVFCFLGFLWQYSTIPAGPAPSLGAGLYHCPAPPSVPASAAHYAMDEPNWNGTADEVADASGNDRHGVAANGATTAGVDAAIPGSPGTCRYGVFDGNDDYVQVPNLSDLLRGTASLAFWIHTTQTGDDTGWMAPGVTGVEQNGGADDIFWGWLDGSGHIGISVANDFATKSTIPINSGTWRHVVLTRDATAGQYKIYIDGALNASGAIATGLIGTPFSSIGRIEDTGGTPEHFAGRLDEVHVFGVVLDDAEVLALMNQTRPCTSGLHHLRIQHGSGNGITCNPTALTITACADATCSAGYTGGVTGTLTATGTPTVNFIGGAGFAIPPGNTSTVRDVHVTTAGAVVFGTSNVTPGPAGASPVCNFGSPLCTFTAADAGFVFDVPNHTAAAAQNVTLAAVRTDDTTQQCVPAFQSVNRSVSFWSSYVNPDTGTLPISVNGTDVAGSSPGTAINLSFDANGEAALTVRYADVGEASLNASYAGSGDEAGLLMFGQDDFVARPARFELVIPGNPEAADASGGVFTRAGQDFTVTVEARNAADAVTPNYGRETPAESVQLAKTLVAPAGGNDPALIGSFGPFGQDCSGSPAAAGTACGTFSWPEVGIVQLAPEVADGNYLGSGNVTGTAKNAGRFIPDHFTVTGGAVDARADAACAPASVFSYMGETMRLGFTLTAQNTSNATTQNYAGAFAKLDPTSFAALDIGAIDSAAPTPLSSRIVTDTASGTWSSGSVIVSARFALDRAAAPDGPFQALRLGVRPTDTDGVTLLNAALDLDVDNDATNDRAQVATTDVRYGRLFLQNAFGSELLSLAVPLRAQYYAGMDTGFLTNADDGCTRLTLTLSNPQGNLAVNETCAIDSGTPGASGIGCAGPVTQQFAEPPAAGDFNLHLQAPGAGNDGSVDIGIDGATALALPYLLFDWDGNAGTAETGPTGRATFGVYGGSPRHIYRRERY